MNKENKDHISKFRQYSPTVDDTFAKPFNSGRKPGYQRRQRNVSGPDIIVDRSEQVEYDENPITSEEKPRDRADLSFCDPREREKCTNFMSIPNFQSPFRNAKESAEGLSRMRISW